jgi:oxygen-dependent protoporphyrinogen oxidase
VVVGGGIAGLAAAHACATDPRARALGVRCTIIERERRLGGKLYTEHVDGLLLEHGADSFLAAKPAAATLCRTLGLGDGLIATTPGRAVYVVHGGRLHRFPEGTGFGVPTRFWPIARTGLLSPADKLRLLGDLVLPRGAAARRAATRGTAARDGAIHGCDESIGAFIRRRLGDAALTRLAGPMLGGIYAGDPDTLSLAATFPQLLEWERDHRSLILAAWTRRRRRSQPDGATRGGPRAAARGGPSPMFLGLETGLGTLVEALQRSLSGQAFITGCEARRIRRSGDGPRYVVELDDGAGLDADAVIVAVPAYAAATLMDGLAPAIAARLRGIAYASTATVSLAYRRAQVRHDLDGHGFVVADGEPVAITACTWVSSKWPHRAPAGTALLRCYLGTAGRDAIVDEDDATLVREAVTGLRLVMGIDAAPTFTRVVRWRRALPQYRIGHLDRVADIERGLRDLPTLALAGAAYRGVGVPDCIAQGAAAATRVLDALAVPTAPR